MSEPTRKTCGLVDERDGFRCLICGKPIDGSWPGGSRHHRRPRSHPFPGLHETSNLILVCGSGDTGCHGEIHSQPAWAYSQGYLLHSWEDPLTTPINTRFGWKLLTDDGKLNECETEKKR
jgi:hypothetical protein